MVAPVLAGYVNEIFLDAEQALLEKLESVTVAEMDRKLRRRMAARMRSRKARA